MEIRTKFHGPIGIGEGDIIHFVQPILGFPNSLRYVLLPHSPQSPFLYLQSVDVADLCFVVADPLVFVPDYALAPDEIQHLGQPHEWAALCLCTIEPIGHRISINLRSPLVINKNTRQGGQFVLSLAYPFQHPISQEAAHASINP